MERIIFERGEFVISNQTMRIGGSTINLANIDNMEFFDFPRHSLFSGVKEWLIGLVIMLIVCSIWNSLTIIGDIYIFTIIILIAYNIYEHKKKYYGLLVQTNRREIAFKSESKQFINDIHDTIDGAINSKENNITINLDNRNINTGIISNGNNNKNKIVNKENKDNGK